MILNSINQREFLDRLSRCTPDLEKFVSQIKIGIRNTALYSEFLKNPFTKNPDGTLKFSVSSCSDQINMLEVAQNTEEIKKLIQPDENGFSNYFILLNNSRDLIRPGDELNSPEYLGPKLFVYPDANLLIPTLRGDLARLFNCPAIIKDELTISQIEKNPGGLIKVFRKKIPQDILRGQQTLEKRCAELNDFKKHEINLLYNIILDYFSQEQNSALALSDKMRNSNPKDVAIEFAKQTNSEEGYINRIKKIIEKSRQGNNVNGIGDRILTSTCFGFNLLDNYNKSLILSDDGDFDSLFKTFYTEILPRYMVETFSDAIKTKKPFFLRQPNFDSRLLKVCKEHIDWARKSSGERTIALGISYNPRTNKFSTQSVAEAFRNYFFGIDAYRIGKTQMISEMFVTGSTAEKALEKLLANV